MAEARLFGEWRGPPDPDKADLVEELWVESPLGDGWIGAYRLLPQAGQAVIGELRIFPDEGPKGRHPGQWSAQKLGLRAEAPPGGLSARVVRRVGFDDARSVFDAALAKLVQRFGSDTPLPPLDPFLSGISISELADQASRRPGPSGRDNRFYAAVAAQYVAKIRSGTTEPIKELSTQLGRPASHIRQLLTTARDRGLLTKSMQGRAGGELTELGRAALVARNEEKE